MKGATWVTGSKKAQEMPRVDTIGLGANPQSCLWGEATGLTKQTPTVEEKKGRAVVGERGNEN